MTKQAKNSIPRIQFTASELAYILTAIEFYKPVNRIEYLNKSTIYSKVSKANIKIDSLMLAEGNFSSAGNYTNSSQVASIRESIAEIDKLPLASEQCIAPLPDQAAIADSIMRQYIQDESSITEAQRKVFKVITGYDL